MAIVIFQAPRKILFPGIIDSSSVDELSKFMVCHENNNIMSSI